MVVMLPGLERRSALPWECFRQSEGILLVRVLLLFISHKCNDQLKRNIMHELAYIRKVHNVGM